MNDKLQNALAELVGKANGTLDFMQGELPDFIRQLLQWKLYDAIFWSVALTVFLLLYLYILFKAYREGRLDDCGFQLSIVGVLNIAVAAALVCNVSIALQIWLAPKVFLIEYAARFAK